MRSPGSPCRSQKRCPCGAAAAMAPARCGAPSAGEAARAPTATPTDACLKQQEARGGGGAPCGGHSTCIYLRPGLECGSPLSVCGVNVIPLIVCLTTVFLFLVVCRFRVRLPFHWGVPSFYFFVGRGGGCCLCRAVQPSPCIVLLTCPLSLSSPKATSAGLLNDCSMFPTICLCAPSGTGFPCGGLRVEGPTVVASWPARPVCLRRVAECRQSHVRKGYAWHCLAL